MTDTTIEADDRVRVTTDKPINLSALDAELGGHGLCSGSLDHLATDGVEIEIVACEGSPVTEEELAAGIGAHVPVFSPPPEKPLSDAEIKALRTMLSDVG